MIGDRRGREPLRLGPRRVPGEVAHRVEGRRVPRSPAPRLRRKEGGLRPALLTCARLLCRGGAWEVRGGAKAGVALVLRSRESLRAPGGAEREREVNSTVAGFRGSDRWIGDRLATIAPVLGKVQLLIGYSWVRHSRPAGREAWAGMPATPLEGRAHAADEYDRAGLSSGAARIKQAES